MMMSIKSGNQEDYLLAQRILHLFWTNAQFDPDAPPTEMAITMWGRILDHDYIPDVAADIMIGEVFRRSPALHKALMDEHYRRQPTVQEQLQQLADQLAN